MSLTKVPFEMLSGVSGVASANTASANTAALNAALASGVKTIVLINDGGTYLVNGTITVPDGVSLIGYGFPVIQAASGSFSSGGSVISVGSNVLVQGLKIDANRQNNTPNMNGIYALNVSGTEINGNYVINTEYGIRFTNGNTNRILNNTIDACRIYGISVKLAAKTDTAYSYLIQGNECRNVLSDATASADGQGIIVYGVTGLATADYKNITDVVVNDNICRNCSRGITLTAVSNFTVSGNNCSECIQNTSLGSGICISEACVNGTVSNNTCTHNYDAGILLDVVDQAGDRFSYGYMSVTGNSCDRNVRTGIKINSMPYTTISGNSCSNSIWGIFLAKGGYNSIVGNTVLNCSENAIRIPGIVGAIGNDQTNVVVADNILANCVSPSGSTYAALYVDYFNTVKIQNNIFKNNTQDLTVKSTCANVTLLDNRFTSNLYVDTSDAVQRWNDEFRTTASGKDFFSNQFGGSGMVSFRVENGFTIPHFGLSWVPLRAPSPVTSSAVTAIYEGYEGQRLRLINYNTEAITILHNANTKNLGSASIVLAYGETVEYEYATGLWVQTVAKVATTL